MATDRRVQRTNSAIFSALRRLSEEKAVSQMTVTQVTQMAGITRKTFYDHFSTVADAYQAMLDDAVAQVAQKTEHDWETFAKTGARLAPQAETELRLRLFLGYVRELLEDQLVRSRRRNRHLSPDELAECLPASLTKHVESGLFGDASRFQGDNELVASFIVAGTLWAHRQGIMSAKPADFSRIQQRTCALLMGGISTLIQVTFPPSLRDLIR